MRVYILYTVVIAALCLLREIMCDLHRWFDLQKLTWWSRKRKGIIIAGYLFYILTTMLIIVSIWGVVHCHLPYWGIPVFIGMAAGKAVAMVFQYN